MKICLLDSNSLQYDSNDLYTTKIRGAEIALINLSINFARLGHETIVINNCKKNISIRGVKWLNLKSIEKNSIYCDLAISNNDVRLFNLVQASKKVLISHSIQSIEKFIRQRQAISFLKHRPTICLLGNYHLSKRSYFLRMFGHFITEWGVDDIFINEPLDIEIDNRRAIFTSVVYRNLDKLINIWKERIWSENKKLNLLITPINKNFEKYNIFNRDNTSKNALIRELSRSRVCLIPGHKSETFCIAAEEARELCVPIVTLGIGSLSERIEHGVTGFIANNEKEFADYTLELFIKDDLYNRIKKNLMNQRGIKQWSKIADDFLNKVIK